MMVFVRPLSEGRAAKSQAFRTVRGAHERAVVSAATEHRWCGAEAERLAQQGCIASLTDNSLHRPQ
eukprot:249298-Amphidinium_carterae.1